MGRERAEETSAARPVGTNLMEDHRDSSRGFPRALVAVALMGSAAAGDAEIKVFIGDEYIGRIQNIRTGTVIGDLADWQPLTGMIAAGEQLRAEISKAGGTNILVFHYITRP